MIRRRRQQRGQGSALHSPEPLAVRAVIFDRDNTLVHFDLEAVALLEARVAAAAPHFPPGAAVEHWLSWTGPWPGAAHEEPAFWRAFWGSLAACHGPPAAGGAALEALGGFYHTCFRAYPDTLPALTALRGRGLSLAVLTNFELPSVAMTLAYAGIDPGWFAALLSSAAIGCHKPEPAAYMAAAAALDLEPAACAFVDDLPQNVEAAAAVGMRPVLLDRDDVHGACPMPRVRALAELVDLLAGES